MTRHRSVPPSWPPACRTDRCWMQCSNCAGRAKSSTIFQTCTCRRRRLMRCCTAAATPPLTAVLCPAPTVCRSEAESCSGSFCMRQSWTQDGCYLSGTAGGRMWPVRRWPVFRPGICRRRRSLRRPWQPLWKTACPRCNRAGRHWAFQCWGRLPWHFVTGCMTGGLHARPQDFISSRGICI